MSDPYAADKALYHLDRLAALKHRTQPVPLHVQLIVSDLCNHNCSFCAYRMSGNTNTELFGGRNPNRMMAFDKACEILDDCAALGVKAIQFTGGGEPTVHPRHEDIFQHALDLGLECALVSNGQKMSERLLSLLPRFSWVRISLDAGDSRTYAAIRGVKPVIRDRVLANIRHIRSAIDLAGSACVLGVGFVVSREAHLEAADAARTARRSGAHNVRLGAVFSHHGIAYYDGILDAALASVERAKDEADPTFAVIDMFTERVRELEQGHPHQEFCGYQHLTTYIGADLGVYRCCNLAYSERGKLGDLREQRFAAFWFSESKRERMARFDARSCERCQFQRQNTLLDRLIVQPKPEHANFV